MYGRVGTGYVYAGDYTTPEEAERTLREFAGPRAADLEANHIRMRIGRSRNSWVGDCVAIGLAGGFVEPLESTGIFFSLMDGTRAAKESRRSRTRLRNWSSGCPVTTSTWPGCTEPAPGLVIIRPRPHPRSDRGRCRRSAF
ncbi:hypothetical protein GCM10027176_70940 [Actinoallomurus bryophytorum]